MKHIWHDVNSSPVRVTGTECSLCYCNTRHSIYAHYPVHLLFCIHIFIIQSLKTTQTRRTWFLRPALAKGTILLHKQKPEGDECVTGGSRAWGGVLEAEGLILVQTKEDRHPASRPKYVWGCCFLNSSLQLALPVSFKQVSRKWTASSTPWFKAPGSLFLWLYHLLQPLVIFIQLMKGQRMWPLKQHLSLPFTFYGQMLVTKKTSHTVMLKCMEYVEMGI